MYDTDYVAWLQEQAHLRAGSLAALDVANVAEELESLMRKERRQLANRLEVIIQHLLKWDHQPNQRANWWPSTIQKQRTRIRRLLNDSPGLKPELEPTCRDVYADVVRAAAIETVLNMSVVPSELPYSIEEIFERALPAEELPDQRSTRKKPG